MFKNKNVKDLMIESEGVFSDVRSALNFLIVDETEAIEGYDNILRCDNITTEHRAILEEIRNEEIAHIVKLSNIYKELATGSIEPETLEELQDKNISDTNYIYETDKPSVKWRIHQSKTGSFYFKDPDGNIYKENGSEVRFESKQSAGEFFIKKLFNKSLWGGDIPKVVVDIN